MKNPDKYLREGYLAAIQAQGLAAYNKDLPPDTNPLPGLYVLIESQSKKTTERSKEDFEWVCRVTMHIVRTNTRGTSFTADVDDAEELCITAIEAGIIVNNFYLKSTYHIDSLNLDLTDKTTTIERRVLIYEHWLSEIGLGATGPTNPGTGGVTVAPRILIPAGTSIPYLLTFPGYGPYVEIVTEVIWIDPVTHLPTGQLVRVYDIPAIKQDSNGDGTGYFTGWKIFGHDDGAGNFKEDTYVSLL